MSIDERQSLYFVDTASRDSDVGETLSRLNYTRNAHLFCAWPAARCKSMTLAAFDDEEEQPRTNKRGVRTLAEVNGKFQATHGSERQSTANSGRRAAAGKATRWSSRPGPCLP